MKPWLVMSLAAAVGSVAGGGGAGAQNGPRYGGGFIELLMNGREPTGAPLRSPPVIGGRVQPAYQSNAPLYADPFQAAAAASRGRQVAGLQQPPMAGESRIARAIDPRFQKQVVEYRGPHAPGTIVIDTPSKFLYLVEGDGRALRYGIGVGRPGFEWAGVKTVTRKAEWPDWTPPPQMRQRRPDLPAFMKGGPENPMGARALYLGSSLYRIHGTNEPWTIGQAVSSGCIRMMNDDVVDLYGRARVGTKVIVI